MTTVDIRPTMPAPQPSRTGQGTAVEQSRAVAEVEAAIVVAMRHPRDVSEAVKAMREACGHQRLAEKAFYRFPRGGQTISDASIHLARELARVWGNFQYGIAELRRDDEYAQSEMIAFAWDVQTNARNSSTFIVPHLRDKKGGPERLTDVREIYEHNANMGARRVREAIFNSLPTWFVEEAKDLCTQTLKHGGGVPLARRVADAIKSFGAIGVTRAQLEAKIGRAPDEWIDQDVAQLGVIFRSIERGEVRKEDEFESAAERVTAAEILGNGQPAANGAPKPEAVPTQTPAPGTQADPAPPSPEPAATGREPLTRPVLNRLRRHLRPLGPEADALDAISAITGRAVIALDELSPAEADKVIAEMEAAVEAAGGDTEQAAQQIWAKVKGPRQDEPVVEDPPADLFSPEEPR